MSSSNSSGGSRSGSMQFDFTSPQAARAQRAERGHAFRILVLGDFGGGTGRGSLATRRPVTIDIDNLDEVTEEMGVQIRLPLGDAQGRQLNIPIKSLDDFHPDQLVQRLDVFQALRRLREMLMNASTYESAARHVRALAGIGDTVPAAAAAAPPDTATGEPADSMMERLLGRPSGSSTATATPATSGAQGLIDSVVRPYIVPTADPQQKELVGVVDDAIAAQMRAILHHPRFQAVESAWRSIYFLLSRVMTDEELSIHLLDISKEQLAADLAASADLSDSGIYKMLVEQTVATQGGRRWAVIIGDYLFDDGDQDVGTLARMASVAQAAGAPFIAGVGPGVVGCDSVEQMAEPRQWNPTVGDAWQKLRRLPAASYVGLAFPRLLLRLPYGKETDPTERLRFEELSERFGHEQYLWGNPAFAAACVLADAFREDGWDLQPGGFVEIGDLPLHARRVNGELQVQPCAEALLTDRAADAIRGRGVIPVLSVKECNAARFAGFASIADPPRALSGRWGD